MPMEKIMVSPEYQVVIPIDVRKSLDIHPGQEVHVIQYDNRVEIIPVRPLPSSRGMLKGIDTNIEREADRV